MPLERSQASKLWLASGLEAGQGRRDTLPRSACGKPRPRFLAQV